MELEKDKFVELELERTTLSPSVSPRPKGPTTISPFQITTAIDTDIDTKQKQEP